MKSFETVERFCSCKKAHVICSEELLLVKPWKLAFAFLFLSVLNFGLKYQILGSENGQKKKTKKQNKTKIKQTKEQLRKVDTSIHIKPTLLQPVMDFKRCYQVLKSKPEVSILINHTRCKMHIKWHLFSSILPFVRKKVHFVFQC